jgi:hypothetical protein
MLFNWLYLLAEDKLPALLHKPLVTCFKCVSGQWAMWAYIGNTVTIKLHYVSWVPVATVEAPDFSAYFLFACACAGVAFSILLHKILDHE